MTTVVTGTMYSSTIIHLGRFVTQRQGVKLYEPRCARMRQFHHVTYLLETGEPVTCKKCLAYIAKHSKEDQA